MFENASQLQDYYRTRQGRHVAARLRRTVSEFWSRAPNACNAAIGYAQPVVRAEDPTRQILMMPLRLGTALAGEGPRAHGPRQQPQTAAAERPA